MKTKFEVWRFKNGKPQDYILTCAGRQFDSEEDALKEINSSNYTWRDGEEIGIVRVSYNIVSHVRATVVLTGRQL